MRQLFSIFLLMLFSSAYPQAATSPTVSASSLLEPPVREGESFADVFSRTIAFRAAGLDDVVRRVSGTGVYTAKEISSNRLVFKGSFLYDGRPESKGETEFRDHGRISCWEGHCANATDASGLLYNAGLWGEPKGNLHKGMSWTVQLREPWELGPAGRQTVTVVSVDSAEHSVTLKREGNGTGPFANDKKEVDVTKDGKTYTAEISPGPSHWSGYTTFRNGIILSDELLVERPVTLTNHELGTIAGTQREYILLNLAPNI